MAVSRTNSAINSAIGFRRQSELLRGLFNGEVGGKVTEAAPRLCRGHSDLLLGRRNDACAFFVDGGLDALLVLLALLLHLGANFGDLVVEPRELRFDGGEARVGIGSGLAGVFKVLA